MRFHQNIQACGYALCRLFVTNLANGPHVSVEAAMCTSRHTLLLLTVPAKLWGKNLKTRQITALT